MKDKESKSLVDRFNSLVINIGNWVSWLYLFVVFISVFEVVMRYIFNNPTVWVHETSLSLSAILMVYAGLYAFAKDKHISIAIIVDLFPQKIKNVCMIISDLISLFYMTILSISMILITKQALFSPSGQFQLERSGSSWNSIFPGVVKFFVCIFIVLFVIQIVLDILSKIKAIKISFDNRSVH